MATSNYRTIHTDFIEGVTSNKNYISNSTFENGDIYGWSTFNTTLTSGLPTGAITSGSAAITTFATTQTNPLTGSYSLQAASSGAWTAGHGFISDAFTIERQDLAKPLTFSFSYEATVNPTNANWSGILGSQTFAVYLHDGTNWIQPSGFLGMNQSSGVGIVTGSFQSSSTVGQQYRLAVIALQASSGAITVNFDNFKISNIQPSIGYPVTDYIDYTPTCSWTSGFSITGKYRRVGDTLECIVKLTSGNSPIAASETTFGIPSGYTIDTAKLLNPAQGAAPTYGDAIGYDISLTNLYLFRVQYWTTTTVKLFYQSASSGQESAVTTSVPPTWAVNDTIIATFKVPVVGLSSSVEMSNATDTRVVAAKLQLGTANYGLTANTAIVWNSAIFDTHGAWDGSSIYKIPVSGKYQISLNEINLSTATATYFKVYKNGSALNGTGTIVYSAATDIVQNNYIIDNFNAGDEITIVPSAGSAGSPAITYSAGLRRANVSFCRVSGPSVIAASETVACRYTNTAGTTITTGGLTVTFPTKDYDTHSFFNGATGVATIPVSGKYRITSSLYTQAVNLSTSQSFDIFIIKNGVTGTPLSRNGVIGTGGSTGKNVMCSQTLSLNAGETIQIYALIAIATGLSTSANYNFICIERVGN